MGWNFLWYRQGTGTGTIVNVLPGIESVVELESIVAQVEPELVGLTIAEEPLIVSTASEQISMAVELAEALSGLPDDDVNMTIGDCS